jgi:hypothetical protein
LDSGSCAPGAGFGDPGHHHAGRSECTGASDGRDTINLPASASHYGVGALPPFNDEKRKKLGATLTALAHDATTSKNKATKRTITVKVPKPRKRKARR